MSKITSAEVNDKIKKNSQKTKAINKEEDVATPKKKVKKVKRVKKSSPKD